LRCEVNPILENLSKFVELAHDRRTSRDVFGGLFGGPEHSAMRELGLQHEQATAFVVGPRVRLAGDRGGENVAVAAEAVRLIDVLDEAEAATEILDLTWVLAVREVNEASPKLQRRPAAGVVDVVDVATGLFEELR
jgi:hypothetical protein